MACNPAVELVQLAVGTRQVQAIMSKSNSDTIRLAYVFILLLKVKKNSGNASDCVHVGAS